MGSDANFYKIVKRIISFSTVDGALFIKDTYLLLVLLIYIATIPCYPNFSHFTPWFPVP